MDVEFDSTIPNMTLDPSGATMRTTLYYLDSPVTGDMLITRNGSIFHLAPQGHVKASKNSLSTSLLVSTTVMLKFAFGMTPS